MVLARGRKVSQADLPPQVAELVESTARAVSEKQRAIEAEIAAIRKGALLESNPWLRLWLRLMREIRELPMMQGTKHSESGSLFVTAFSFAKLFAPKVIEQVRDDMRAGGLARVQKRLFSSDSEPADSEPADSEPAFHPAMIRSSALALRAA
ncbi:MAG TPA: hypothetical protein VNO30_23135 [Kofleriaceae bacterium]|nr:hypothetical protein [Kofleriaceae bacterium]